MGEQENKGAMGEQESDMGAIRAQTDPPNVFDNVQPCSTNV